MKPARGRAGEDLMVGANSAIPSFTRLAIQGAGQNINEAGQQITRRNLNIQPTIEVAPAADSISLRPKI